MSTTPEEIAAELDWLAEVKVIGAWHDDLRAAAALIRAQTERLRVLEDLIEDDNIVRQSQINEHGEAPDGSVWRWIKINGVEYLVPYEVAMWRRPEPERELLREALKALDRQRVWHEGHDKTLSKQPPNTDVRWRRLEHQEQAEDARAAADKIRAALTQEKK